MKGRCVIIAVAALVWSPSHFTWMDTNYPACTPRVGYPVEIQALWISALRFLGRGELADKELDSLKRLYKRKDAPGYFDCLAAPNGESAARHQARQICRGGVKGRVQSSATT